MQTEMKGIMSLSHSFCQLSRSSFATSALFGKHLMPTLHCDVIKFHKVPTLLPK